MPYADLNGAHIHYTDTGGDGAPIVFSHGLLFSGEMFEAQVAHFSAQGYRCITFDHRGQGQSGVTEDGYDMDTLTEDAAQLIAHLGVSPCHFAGLSMGGFVGMRLAVRRSEVLKSLILLETSADPEPEENRSKYLKLNFVARWIGLWAVINKVMPIMFSQSYLNDPNKAVERDRWKKLLVGNHKIGITRAVLGVTHREPVFEELGGIDLPTLVVVGDEDVATVPAKSERIHGAIRGSELVVIPKAGHSSTVEQPDAVNAVLERFLGVQAEG
ncbi:alpha/beta fold hydrolase [Shimia sediminis]|uniref:alpha/beta fold hydrolase n=1 Tax=Shimia sediminis TaxID=2497945 RepID=UPI000F8C83B4|nr:alpha/beta fold hydrolase [Shimia sediminis]